MTTSAIMTVGQKGYEQALVLHPNGLDGSPRLTWDELPEFVQKAWERTATKEMGGAS